MKVSVSNPYTDDVIQFTMHPDDRVRRVKLNILTRMGMYDDTQFTLIHNDTALDANTPLRELCSAHPNHPHLHFKMVLGMNSGFLV